MKRRPGSIPNAAKGIRRIEGKGQQLCLENNLLSLWPESASACFMLVGENPPHAPPLYPSPETPENLNAGEGGERVSTTFPPWE